MVKEKEKNYILGTELGTKGPEFNVFEKIGLGVASGALKIPEATNNRKNTAPEKGKQGILTKWNEKTKRSWARF